MTTNINHQKLFSLHNRGIKLGLENTLSFLELLGNPHLRLNCIHIAGSNGKGSTSSFIASILTEAGYKVGLYTSPHFIRFNERIKIGNVEIENDFIDSFIEKYFAIITEMNLTFFEVTTALMFLYFDKKKVDYVVLETGLGGRLDSTNVVNPLASVITSISLEHTNILGDTISAIAKEKAEIIKSNKPVFIADLPIEAELVCKEKVKETNSILFNIKDLTTYTSNSFSLVNGTFSVLECKPELKGSHQLRNAALAALVCNELFTNLESDVIVRGLQNVVKNTGISGRFEIYGKNKNIYLDSAHNKEGIETFLKEFSKYASDYTERKVLFTALNDKSVEEMIQSLAFYFDRIFLFELKDNDRAMKMADLQEIAYKYFDAVHLINNLEVFIKFMISDNKKKDAIAILGSMYFLGEVKAILHDFYNK